MRRPGADGVELKRVKHRRFTRQAGASGGLQEGSQLAPKLTRSEKGMRTHGISAKARCRSHAANATGTGVDRIDDLLRGFTQTTDTDNNQARTFQSDWTKADGMTLDFKEIRSDNGSTQIIPY